MIAGIAAGVAVALLAAAAAAFFVLRRRRRNRAQTEDADDWLKPEEELHSTGTCSAAENGASSGAFGATAQPRGAPMAAPPAVPTAVFVAPADEVATLPTVQEPLDDDETLGTYPTRPGAPCPASLASIVAAMPAAGTPPAASPADSLQVNSWLHSVQYVAVYVPLNAGLKI